MQTFFFIRISISAPSSIFDSWKLTNILAKMFFRAKSKVIVDVLYQQLDNGLNFGINGCQYKLLTSCIK